MTVLDFVHVFRWFFTWWMCEIPFRSISSTGMDAKMPTYADKNINALASVHEIKCWVDVSYAHPLSDSALSQLCLICSRGPWKCETPGGERLQYLSSTWSACFNRPLFWIFSFFLPAHTMGYHQIKKIVHMGGHDRQAERVEKREKNEPPPTPVLAPRPHAVSSRVTLPWKTFSCIFSGPVRSDPLPTELHPPPSVRRSSKARCLLLSEATHEININLTSDRML